MSPLSSLLVTTAQGLPATTRTHSCRRLLAKHRQFHTSRTAPSPAADKKRGVSLGILRESYNVWERRTPLCPHHVVTLLSHPSVDSVLVQPSSSRIYSNVEYEMAGAILQENLEDADLILGVKRPRREDSLHPHKSYMFFSHVIKGQPENMALLQYILNNKIQLYDYECIVQGGMQETTTCKERKQKRLVAFGKFAGRAGMTDALNPLGRRLLALGFSTPFLQVPPAHMQNDWTAITKTVRQCGERIAVDGLPPAMEPVVVAMTGRGGNVYSGVRDVFDLLPHKMVSVDELPDVMNQAAGSTTTTTPQHCVYGVSLGPQDVFQERGSDRVFDRDRYRANPQDYESTFHERIAPYTNLLVNGMYWDLRYPRLLTKEQMQHLYMDGNKRLMLVVDISCDVNGSIEFLERTTNIDRPYFQYDPISKSAVSESISSDGVTVMGVDILPTELPRDSSDFFGDALMPVLQKYIDSKATAAEDTLESKQQFNGPSELTNACIASDGSLTPSFRHLQSFLKRPSGRVPPAESKATIWMEGQLFDSGFINHALDIIEQNDCTFEIVECNVRRKQDGTPIKSNVIIRIAAEDDQRISRIEEQLSSLMNIMVNAEASFKRLDDESTDVIDTPSPSATVKALPKEERILVLGSGLVSKSLVEYLGRESRRTVTVAGAIEDEARSVCQAAKNGRHVSLDVQSGMDKVAELIQESDIVVSLLPAPMHPVIANACIDKSTDLVTASYESEAMRQLGERAMANGVRILNEVGLDPGLDHMSAMKVIDDIHSRGGVVKGFSSVCGGLPSPEAADNPLMYKFSWSPMGVLSACKNDAVYRWDNEIKAVDGHQLLRAASPFSGAWPSLRLECLPNRNSLLYEAKYKIPHAEDLFRGTLRFGGVSGIMSVFQTMGLLEAVRADGVTWSDVLDSLRKRAGFETFDDYILYCAGGDVENAARAAECLDFLGMEGTSQVADPDNLLASFCEVLKLKCRYEEGERDMCLMHTSIRAVFDDEVEERHRSSLQVFGDSNHSAMSKTVGYTAAAATDLLLNDSSLASSGGLLLPITKDVYLPILDALAKEGVQFKEEVKIDTAESTKPQAAL